jgi:DNA-binding PadR family transcriptional regulator
VQRPAHGYDLHLRLVTELGFVWHISLSQVYNILNRLEVQGLITGSTEKQSSRPDRRIFEITQVGKERFETWLHTPTSCSVHAIRLEFTTRLYFISRQDVRQTIEMIALQRGEVLSGIENLRGFLPTIPSDQMINRLALELRISQLENILDWLSRCDGEITSLSFTS